MVVENLKRKFIFKSNEEEIVLPDVDSNFTVDQIRKFYSNSYPELLNTSNPAGNFEEGEMVYRFSDAIIGDKG